jgi:hypothetical protein
MSGPGSARNLSSRSAQRTPTAESAPSRQRNSGPCNSAPPVWNRGLHCHPFGFQPDAEPMAGPAGQCRNSTDCCACGLPWRRGLMATPASRQATSSGAISTTPVSVAFATCPMFPCNHPSIDGSATQVVLAWALLRAYPVMLARHALTVQMLPSPPAVAAQAPFWTAPLTTRVDGPGRSRSPEARIRRGMPGRSGMASGRRYSGVTPRGASL